jgi:hypothetical protein
VFVLLLLQLLRIQLLFGCFYLLWWSFSYLFFGHHLLPYGGGRWFCVVFVIFAGALLFTGLLCFCSVFLLYFVFLQQLGVCFVCGLLFYVSFEFCQLPPGGSGSGSGAWN